MESGCEEDRLPPPPFIVRYSLADDTESSFLFKLSSFLLLPSTVTPVLATPSIANVVHAVKCAAGLHNPLQAFFFSLIWVRIQMRVMGI